jgi:hypothetical protein
MYIRKEQNYVRGVAKDVQFQECQNFIFDVHKIEAGVKLVNFKV